MIELIDVTKEYGKSGVRAVDQLTMKVEKGELFGFIGPNGAGKTTTIKMLTGILTPTSGTVLLDGVDIVRDPIKAKKMIGFVPDGADLFDRLTGLEYLNFMADIYGVSAEQRKQLIEIYGKAHGRLLLAEAAHEPVPRLCIRGLVGGGDFVSRKIGRRAEDDGMERLTT